jgi:hypothetical protein
MGRRYDPSVEATKHGEGAGIDWAKYDGLTFDRFRQLAVDPTLSDAERVGFPDVLRHGAEKAILSSISNALDLETRMQLRVLDIGPGCSRLAHMLIALCRTQGHTLFLVDSQEMLDQLPDDPDVRKRPGRFPDVQALLDEQGEKIDAIVIYSVLHHVFLDGDVWSFFDAALSLLRPTGSLLLGDVPNVSKRNRFFASEQGIASHREYMATSEKPKVEFNRLAPGRIDDAVVFGLLARARAAGFDSYLLPQPEELPMSNRREDILIRRP